VEAAVRETIASAYMSLFERAEAQKHLERVVELRKSIQGSRHPDTLQWMSNLASVLYSQAKYADAAALLKAVLAERSYGTPEHAMTASNILSVYRDGRNYSDAKEFIIGLLDEDRRKGASGNTATHTHIALLVALYRSWIPAPKYSEAEAVLKEALARQRGEHGNPVLRNVNQLASLNHAQDKFREAEELLVPLVPDALVAKVLAGGRSTLEQYPTLLDSMSLLVEVYGKQNRPVQADALFSNVNKLMDSRFFTKPGKEDITTPLSSMALMATNYVRVGRDADADKLVPRVLEGFRLVVDQKDAATREIRFMLLSLVLQYVNQGKHARAQQLYRDILDIHLSSLSDEDFASSGVGAGATAAMFIYYGARDSFEKTEQLMTQVVHIQRRVLGESGNFRTAMWSLSQVYLDHAKYDLAHGRPGEARLNYEKADELIAELVKVFRAPAGGVDQSRAFINLSRQAQVRASLGRYDEAEVLFAEVLGYRRGNPNEVRNLPLILAELGWVRILQGKYSEAELVLREGCGRFEVGAEMRYNCDSLLGASLVGQTQFAEAEPLLLSGYDGLLRAVVDERPTTNAGSRLVTSRFFPQDAGAWIVRLYEEWGKPEQAAEWKKKLEAAKSRAN
jgi:tetratricopeptide (TPR) repeat protein